jgi:hypothetical protein
MKIDTVVQETPRFSFSNPNDCNVGNTGGKELILALVA